MEAEPGSGVTQEPMTELDGGGKLEGEEGLGTKDEELEDRSFAGSMDMVGGNGRWG